MKNKSYIGLSFVVLVFGIIFIPKIINRIKSDTVVQGDRLDAVSNHKNGETGLVTIGPVPKFELINQNETKINNKSAVNFSQLWLTCQFSYKTTIIHNTSLNLYNFFYNK